MTTGRDMGVPVSTITKPVQRLLWNMSSWNDRGWAGCQFKRPGASNSDNARLQGSEIRYGVVGNELLSGRLLERLLIQLVQWLLRGSTIRGRAVLPEERCAVAIMAKASVVGTVKTRLVPPLTSQEAAELNTCCLTDVAANIVAAAGRVPIQGFAAYYPQGSEPFFDDLLPVGFKLLPPREPTIGRSLIHAARDLFATGYSSVCLVNADSPTLPTEFLVETVLRLREPGDRVVLGPAADGGYYLIGLKQFHRRLFEEINWSTERVFQQTLARAGEIGVKVVALPEWYDVDDEVTLTMLAREIGPCRSAGGPYLDGYPAPSTTAFLEKLAAEKGDIERVFERAALLRCSLPRAGKG
jgi:uncharacterized protein